MIAALPTPAGSDGGQDAEHGLTVSVIIPCYNYGRFLRDCLNSVLSQEGVTVTVLILDDASADETATVGVCARRDQRVTYRRHETNHGHIATYNEGIAWAASEFTVLLSADDVLVPGALRRSTALLRAHSEVGLVYGGIAYLRQGEPTRPLRTDGGNWRIWDGDDWVRMVCRKSDTGIMSPEVVVRTSVQQRVGGYREDLPHLADTHMWLRFAYEGKVGQIRGVDHACYRLHDTQMSHEISDYAIDIGYIREKTAVFDSVLQEDETRESLHQFARRQIARSLLRATTDAYLQERLDDAGADARARLARSLHPRAAGLAAYWLLALARLLGPAQCRRLRSVLEIITLRSLRLLLGAWGVRARSTVAPVVLKKLPNPLGVWLGARS